MIAYFVSTGNAGDAGEDEQRWDRQTAGHHSRRKSFSLSLLPLFMTPGHSGCRDIVFYAR
jgi:hypothetical protein